MGHGRQCVDHIFVSLSTPSARVVSEGEAGHFVGPIAALLLQFPGAVEAAIAAYGIYIGKQSSETEGSREQRRALRNSNEMLCEIESIPSGLCD